LELLKKTSSHDFARALRTDGSQSEFSRKFDEFLAEYGHRSHTREIYFPRWADDPSLVVDVLKALVTASEVDIDALERQKHEERTDAEKLVLERISKLRFGLIKKLLFKTVLKYAQTYLMFRENQRFYLDHQIYRQRRLFMEYARRFAERGIIDTPSDIFFLSKEEIFRIASRQLSISKAAIAERRREFDQYSDRLPPKFLRGTTEFDDTVVSEAGALKITGTAASPGIATGLVRVAFSVNDLPQVREGEILVTSNTDPGWTPVFPKLGGLVTETGGILSHGAVVSREYNIPAVTAVKDATKMLKTGQEITVDGNDGTIYVKDR
jgi:pyruvate,water dikinase